MVPPCMGMCLHLPFDDFLDTLPVQRKVLERENFIRSSDAAFERWPLVG